MTGFAGNIVTSNETHPEQQLQADMQCKKNIQWRSTHKEYVIHLYEDVPYPNKIVTRKDSTSSHTSSKQVEYTILFDGDLYNTLELVEDLNDQGYEIHTTSSSEILVALYHHKQEKVLEDLRGAFSFIIWDEEKGELFGARDRFGLKPFYYMTYENELYFASEMKMLQKYMKRDEISHESLHNYFSFQYVPEPQTIYRNIHILQPGNYFYKKVDEKMDIHTYWYPILKPTQRPFEEKVEHIRESLRDSVHLHMQSDQKIGAFLSGGVDSSAIVSLAKEVDPHLQTFTVGFEREGYSEIHVAKETAEQLQVENIHYVISAQEFVEHLREITFQLDEPVADPAAIPLYFIAREAYKHVDIALSGEGADELFGGYNIYREPIDLQLFERMPKLLKNTLKTVAKVIPEGVRGKSFIERGTTDISDRFIGNANIFSEKEKSGLLRNYNSNYHFTNVTKPIYDEVSHLHAIHQMQSIDLRTWLRGDILVKADRLPQAHGLNIRSPFLDINVFNIASELQPYESIAHQTTKYALREAMRGIVSDSVLYNRKLGFPVPIRHWLKNDLYEWVKEVIHNSDTDDFIRKSYVLNMLEIHRSGKRDVSRKLWTILCFMIWHELYVE